MNNFSITHRGNPLAESQYTIDLDEKVLTIPNGTDLVLDFNGCMGWTFKTYHNCYFNTSDDCTFNTGSHCTFKTGDNCTFDTGGGCSFKTGWDCTFDTGERCNFHTMSCCTFDTGDLCTFSLYNMDDCKFKSYSGGNSIILNRENKNHYILTEEFVTLQKVMNG